ncbi:glycosyltransferase family 2 protein [Yersinia enterocolitica]|nr:glycosyltransferase family 2 protein [Yersinia enterocolitica]HDL8434774.1 glycosyltransferase family 2 protein [Yersinia enterocolitica]HDL8471943.1 glycosyltransferase family 2 protein [Yersinia enterocolitica]
MINSPLVSILIPVYQREKYIGEAIDAALSQTYENIEVIIVDNASHDNTWQICQDYSKKDNRIKIYKNDSNLGPVENWKKCFEYATGFYAKILWSDDKIDPTYISKALPLMASGDVGMVFSSVIIGRNYNKEEYQSYCYGVTGLYPSTKFIDELLYGNNLPVSPGCAILRLNDLRSNLILDIKSPSFSDFSKHGAGPDLLLMLLTIAKYPKVGFVNEPLSFFRDHNDSITVSMRSVDLMERYQQAKLWFAERYYSEKQFSDFISYIWVERSIALRRITSRQEVAERFGSYSVKPSYFKGLIVFLNLVSKKVKKRLWN